MMHDDFAIVAGYLGNTSFTLLVSSRGYRVMLDDKRMTDEAPRLDEAITRALKLQDTPHVTRDSDFNLLKLRDVEAELKVSRDTLLRWIKSGKLEAVRFGPQQWRVHRSVVDRMKGDRT